MKVLLVDDHALFREGVCLILRQYRDDVHIDMCETAQAAIDMATAKHADGVDYDLVLLDYNLPDSNGEQCLQQLASTQPNSPIVMLSGNNDAVLIQRLLGLGAKGYITKNVSMSVMLSAIQLVLSGGIYVPTDALGASAVNTEQVVPVPSAKPANSLTERQTDVLREMSKGLSNKEIARQLAMSPSTVKVHLAAIFRELDVTNRTQAVTKAKTLSLV